jgi:hypothetical protein
MNRTGMLEGIKSTPVCKLIEQDLHFPGKLKLLLHTV